MVIGTSKKNKKNSLSFDYIFFAIVVGLLVVGLLVMYSASTVESFKNFGTANHYFFHQLVFGGVLGFLALYICSRLDYHLWQKLAPLAVIIAALLLIVVKIPGVGFSSGGATRWLKLGPIIFQPAELAKLALVLYVSSWLTRRSQQLHDFYSGVLPALVITGLFAVLVLWQPDVGTMLVLVATIFGMLYMGGVKLSHLGLVLALGVLCLLILIKIEPYRAQRLTTFLNPSFDKLGISYQINQALLAIGSGGLFGYGYGMSRQKHKYLPEAIGDSIFAIMAEELGLIRISVVLGLFLAFALRGLKIATSAPDVFGKILATGLVLSIVFQALINIGAIVGILPLTGIPLPFFSYGSSSLIATLAACGILLNISKSR